MKAFKLFKKIYIDSFCGGRVSKRELEDILKDKVLVEEAINKLYTECPTKFPGEFHYEKHYLLNKKWQILNDICTTFIVCKKEPSKTFKYIWWHIEFLLDINDSWNFYMHPTQINRM